MHAVTSDFGFGLECFSSLPLLTRNAKCMFCWNTRCSANSSIKSSACFKADQVVNWMLCDHRILPKTGLFAQGYTFQCCLKHLCMILRINAVWTVCSRLYFKTKYKVRACQKKKNKTCQVTFLCIFKQNINLHYLVWISMLSKVLVCDIHTVIFCFHCWQKWYCIYINKQIKPIPLTSLILNSTSRQSLYENGIKVPPPPLPLCLFLTLAHLYSSLRIFAIFFPFLWTWKWQSAGEIRHSEAWRAE